MGYYTTYTLRWRDEGAPERMSCEHVSRFSEAKFCDQCGVPVGVVSLDKIVADVIAKYKEAAYALQPNGDPTERSKWYEHEADLAAMSREVPGVLLHLSGEGEEPGDLWDLYALDGRIQKHKAKIVRVEEPDLDGWSTPKRGER